MGPTFGHLGLNFRELNQRAAPLCPDAGQPITKTSEWAARIERTRMFAVRLGHKIRRASGYQFSFEAALVKDQVFFSVSPTTARTYGDIWLMATPRRPAGFFYNIWKSREDTRRHKIFSPVSDCPDIDPAFFAMQKRADEVKYSQDFLCEFTQPAERLFTIEIDPAPRLRSVVAQCLPGRPATNPCPLPARCRAATVRERSSKPKIHPRQRAFSHARPPAIRSNSRRSPCPQPSPPAPSAARATPPDNPPGPLWYLARDANRLRDLAVLDL